MRRLAAALALLFLAALRAEAAAQNPNDAAEQYNLGTAQYRRQEYPKAEDALRRSVASAPASLQGKAAYNLGSAQYRQGTQAALKEPDKAQSWLEQALENYRLAVRRNPYDLDAKYNYELTQKHLEAVKKEQEKQKQQDKNQKSEKQEAKDQASPDQQPQQQSGDEKKEQQQSEKKSEEMKQENAQANQADDKEKQEQQSAQGEEKNATPVQQQEGNPKEAKAISEQQALWILDNMQREEYSARANQTKQSAQESNVEQDW